MGREAAAVRDFEAVETAVRRQALRFAARVVEQRLNADHSDFTGARRSCSCGRPARYGDRRAQPFQTVLGELRLERAYYYCAACQRGFCPRDQQWGMENTSLSPAVTRRVGTVGAWKSPSPSRGGVRRRIIIGSLVPQPCGTAILGTSFPRIHGTREASFPARQPGCLPLPLDLYRG